MIKTAIIVALIICMSGVMFCVGAMYGENRTKNDIIEIGRRFQDEKRIDEKDGHIVIRMTKHGQNYIGMNPAEILEIHTNSEGIFEYIMIAPDGK